MKMKVNSAAIASGAGSAGGLDMRILVLGLGVKKGEFEKRRHGALYVVFLWPAGKHRRCKYYCWIESWMLSFALSSLVFVKHG